MSRARVALVALRARIGRPARCCGLVLALLAAGCRSGVPVHTATVTEGPLDVWVVTNGTVEPSDARAIRSRLDGRLLEILEAGTAVQPGSVVARIDATAVSAELARAQSERLAALEELRAARAEASQARERLVADRWLFEKGAITGDRRRQSEIAARESAARAAALAAEVPLRVSKLDLEIAELDAQRGGAIVTTDAPGTVYHVDAHKDQLLHVGDPVLWMADLSRLRVRTKVDQSDLGRVAVGQTARITSNARPDHPLSGTVTAIIPNVVVKDSRAVSEALVQLEGPDDALMPGMSVDVEILVDRARDALRIPSAAVFQEGGGWVAFHVDGNRAHRVPIGLGRSSGPLQQVTGNLQQGDCVVLGPVNDLHDGARVEAIDGDGDGA